MGLGRLEQLQCSTSRIVPRLVDIIIQIDLWEVMSHLSKFPRTQNYVDLRCFWDVWAWSLSCSTLFSGLVPCTGLRYTAVYIHKWDTTPYCKEVIINSRAINTSLLLDKLRKSTRSLFKTNDPQRNPWLTNLPIPNTVLPHIKRSGLLDTVELFINSSYSKAFFISLASYILKAHKT